MSEGFKKWLCELNDISPKVKCANTKCNIDCIHYNIDYDESCSLKLKHRKITLEILINAMWKLNREGTYFMIIDGYQVLVDTGEHNEHFNFAEYDNSEQEALEAALKYIYDNK